MKKTDSLESLKELLQKVQFSAYRSYSLRNDQWKVFTSPLPGNRADTFHAIFLASAVTPGQTNPDGLEICVRSVDQPDIRESAEMNRAGKLVLKDLPVGHQLKLEIPDIRSTELAPAVQKAQPQPLAARTEQRTVLFCKKHSSKDEIIQDAELQQRIVLFSKHSSKDEIIQGAKLLARLLADTIQGAELLARLLADTIQSDSKRIPVRDFPEGQNVRAGIADTGLSQVLVVECRAQAGKTIEVDLQGQSLTMHLDPEGRASAFVPSRVDLDGCVLRFGRPS